MAAPACCWYSVVMGGVVEVPLPTVMLSIVGLVKLYECSIFFLFLFILLWVLLTTPLPFPS